jgi:predicted phage-related endonuclease
MFGLMVTDRDYCLVAALRSFDDVDIFWTLRDDETIDAMRPKLADFWINHVQADIAPDPLKFDDIKVLFPLDNGQSVEASSAIAEKVERLRSVKAQLSSLEAIEEVLKFDIAEAISPHTILTFEGRELMSWKGQNDTRLNTEAFKAAHPDLFAKFSRTKVIRVLRFKKGTR